MLRVMIIAIMATGFSMSLISCEKEESKGSMKVEITDAPSDDANVEATFITIADVKVGDQSIEGFQKTTIDISAYQNGLTKVLADADVEAKAYSNVTLVLDYAADESGNAPGCYVETTNGTKHALEASVSEIEIPCTYTVTEDASSNLVIDFDLRKAIKAQSGNANDEYDFVTAAELSSAVRAVKKEEAGEIKGTVNGSTSNYDKVVIYAYKKGTYDQSTEMSGSGNSNVEFANAVTSAEVNSSGEFELNFLESGDYEVVCATYDYNTTNNKTELTGSLEVSAGLGVLLNDIEVNSSTTVTLSLSITGFLPL